MRSSWWQRPHAVTPWCRTALCACVVFQGLALPQCSSKQDRCDGCFDAVSGATGGASSGGGSTTEPGSIALGAAAQLAGAGNADCPDVEVTLDEVTPTVVFVVDRSSSMDLALDEASDASLSRWDALKSALLDPQTGLVSSLERQVRFGLVLYGNEPPYFPECPDLLEVMPPALDNYSRIESVYGPAPTIPNTPTGHGLQVVLAALEGFTEPGPKYLVLATDGDPDRCDANLGQDRQDDVSKELALSAVQAGVATGVHTFVVSVGRGTVTLSHLKQMANVGAGLDRSAEPGAPYYETGSLDELRSALTEVVGGVASCTFDLDGRVLAREAPRGKVTIDGEEIPMSDSDGWRLVSATQLELVGSACAKLQSAEEQLRATFPCDAIVK